MPPWLRITTCPCARFPNVPSMNGSPVFFTTISVVPTGGAKFSVAVNVPDAV
jgi:hypothetical protein